MSVNVDTRIDTKRTWIGYSGDGGDTLHTGWNNIC